MYFSQKGYIELKRFNMQNAKLVDALLTTHFKLSSALSSQLDDEVDNLSQVPYSSVVDSLIYAMVCSHPHLSYVVSAISRYMPNFGKKH